MKIPFKVIQENGLDDILDWDIEGITPAQIGDKETLEDMWNCLSEEQQRKVLNKMLGYYLDQEDYFARMIKKVYRCLDNRYLTEGK